jgi:hypothetical protein
MDRQWECSLTGVIEGFSWLDFFGRENLLFFSDFWGRRNFILNNSVTT